jgi:hypothetical protein
MVNFFSPVKDIVQPKKRGVKRGTNQKMEVIQPSKYRIILFENLCNYGIMFFLKFSIIITNNVWSPGIDSKEEFRQPM